MNGMPSSLDLTVICTLLHHNTIFSSVDTDQDGVSFLLSSHFDEPRASGVVFQFHSPYGTLLLFTKERGSSVHPVPQTDLLPHSFVPFMVLSVRALIQKWKG